MPSDLSTRPFLSIGFGFPVAAMGERKRTELMYLYSNNYLINECGFKAYDQLNFPLKNWQETIFILPENYLEDTYRQYLFDLNGKLHTIYSPFPSSPPPDYDGGYESVIKSKELKKLYEDILCFIPKSAWGFYFYAYSVGKKALVEV